MKNHLRPILALFIITTSLCRAQNPVLWGVTDAGGVNTDGIIFKYTTSTDSETDVYNFGKGTDGQHSQGSLIQANNGLLYGMTEEGGAYGYGIIFTYNISTGKETDIYDFRGGTTDGEYPFGSLIRANNGLLYGMTEEGGAVDFGIIFSYNILTGIENDIHDFKGTEGAYPNGSFIQSGNGLLYGMTPEGGIHNRGVIFSYNISTATETKIYDFGAGADGQYPYGSLLQVNDSLLYGTTEEGGIYGYGTIFNYNILTVTETDIHDFGNGTDGQYPEGSLIQANNGLLYGMAYWGGVNDYGMIFSYNDSSDNYSDIHDFTGTDGAYPAGSFIQASNGLLYGTTEWGGTIGGYGTIFNCNILTDTETVIHNFGSGTDGEVILGNLVEVDSFPSPINILPQSPSICSGTGVTLVSSGGTTYTWSPSTGLSATTGSTVVASPTVTTIYRVTSLSSGFMVTVTDTVTVIILNKATITRNGNNLISSATQYNNQWYRNDTIILGADNPTYPVTKEGCYSVTASNPANGCSATSDTFCVLSLSGINKLSINSNQLSIYPNPTSSEIILNISSSVGEVKDWNLQITDVLGRIAFSKSSLNYSNDIDLSKLAGGMYFISVINKTGRAVVPVVKQ